MRAYDEGFFTRVTCIPFYPIVSEPELLEVIEGLVRYVNYGIAVTVFPLIKVLPGTEFAQSDEYSILMSQYRLPKKEGFLNLRDYVLPSDTFVRKLALQSMKNTTKELRNIIVQHKIDGDYPSSLGVLAFFSSVISSWLNLGPRIVPRDKLEKMNLIVHDAINTLVRKSLVQNRVHELLRNPDTIKSRQDAAKLFTDEAALPFTIQALRHAIDFGDNHEVVAAAKLVNVLSKYGIGDKHLHESLRYALNRGLTSDQYSVVYSACNAS